MPSASPGAVRKQIAQRTPDPVYLILGDDEAEMSALAAEISALVEDELRAFNVERLYASDRSTTPAAIAEAARVLPMMSSRRVIVVLRAEKILKPKRRRSEAGGQRPEAGGQRPEGGGRRPESLRRRTPPSWMPTNWSDI